MPSKICESAVAEEPLPLALPEPKPSAPRALAEQIVFDLLGPATWEEWDRWYYYRLDWKAAVRRVQQSIEQVDGGGASRG